MTLRNRGSSHRPSALRKGRKASPAPPLPPEVLCNIFEYLHRSYYGSDDSEDQNDENACRADFCSLALVSRGWVREAQRVLFRVIVLRPAIFRFEGRDFRFGGPSTFVKFACLMATSKHLAEHVKELDIMIPRRRSQAKIILSTTVCCALRKIRRLDKLYVRREESPDGPFSLDDCAAHDGVPRIVANSNPTVQAANSILNFGHRKHRKFLRTIFRLLPQITELGLYKISLPSDVLFRCTRLKVLDLQSANLYIDPKTAQDSRSVFCPALEYLEFDGHALICLKTLLDHGMGQKLLLGLSNLKRLSLVIQAPEDLPSNSAQQLVLSKPTALRRLELQVPMFNPEEDPDPATCPLAHLNLASFQTLTFLWYSTSIDLNSDNPIEDPYLGLFCGGVFLMLKQLVDLKLQISLRRKRLEGYRGTDIFGEECQWSQLDGALASEAMGTAQRAFPHLEFVHLAVVLCHDQEGDNRLAKRFIRKVTDEVLERRFPFMTELESEVLYGIFEQLGLAYHQLQDAVTYKKDLCALSLVSRTWTREAQMLAFRVITLRPGRFRLDGQEYRAPDDLFARFAQLMDTSPHLAEYVKVLDIMLPCRGSQGKLAMSSVVSKALCQIHGLMRLDLRKEELPDGPFALEDCSVHSGPPNNSKTAARKHRLESLDKQSQFLATILHHLLPQITELGLHHISLPSDVLSSCTKMCCLEMQSANLYPTDSDSVDPVCPGLKDLQLDGHALVCLKELLDHSMGQNLLLSLSGLQHLSLVIQAVEDLADNSPQQLILSQPTALTRLKLDLHLYAADEQTTIACPLAHLNPAAFRTLTLLSWHASCVLGSEDIMDPYQGLFSGGVFSMLTQLVDLTLQVSLARESLDGYDGDIIFGGQCEWSQLDRALASSSGNAQLAFPHLEVVRLGVVVYHFKVGNNVVVKRFIRKVTNEVLERRFPFVTELASKGKLEFIRQSVARDANNTTLCDA